MRRVKQAKQDYTFAQLPHNRKEVFFDCLKMRFGTVICIGLLLLASSLPLLCIGIFKDVVTSNIYARFVANEITEIQAEAYLNSLDVFAAILSVVGWVAFSLGLAGAVRIIRQLIWGEPVFFWSDFSQGIKQNAGKYVAIFAIVAVVNLISVICIRWLNNVPIVNYIPLVVLIVIVFPIGFYVLAQSAVYDVKFGKSIANGIAFFGKTIWQTLCFALIAIAFGLLRFIPAIIVKYVVIVVCETILLPMYVMAGMLFCCSVFDKYLNANAYPELYDKGVYRMDKK